MKIKYTISGLYNDHTEQSTILAVQQVLKQLGIIIIDYDCTYDDINKTTVILNVDNDDISE